MTYGSSGSALRLGELLGAQYLDADEWFVALDPGIMARRDGVRLAGADGLLRPITEAYGDPPRSCIADVRHLAGFGARDRLDALGPAPARLQVEPTDGEALEPDHLDPRLGRRPRLVRRVMRLDFEPTHCDRRCHVYPL